jgi:WD40 repeat protein
VLPLRLVADVKVLASPEVAELAPDGKQLVLAARRGVWLCDFTGKVTHTYAKSGGYRTEAFIAGERVIGQVGSRIRVWRWRTGKLELDYKPEEHARLQSVSLDGRLALMTSFAPKTNNKALTVWDLRRRRAVASRVESRSVVIGAALAADGSLVVHGGTDGIVRFFDVATQTEVARAKGRGWVDVVARSDDGRFFASGGHGGGAIHVWKPDGTLVRKLPYASRVLGLSLSPDGVLLAAHGTRGRPAIFDVETGARVATLDAHETGVRCLRFSHDGKHIVTAGSDYRVCVSAPTPGAVA